MVHFKRCILRKCVVSYFALYNSVYAETSSRLAFRLAIDKNQLDNWSSLSSLIIQGHLYTKNELLVPASQMRGGAALLFYMIVNRISLVSGLLDRQNKDSWRCHIGLHEILMLFFQHFLNFHRLWWLIVKNNSDWSMRKTVLCCRCVFMFVCIFYQPFVPDRK